MKHILLMLVSMLLLAACSTPKYAYNFDYYDYNSGRKKAEVEKVIARTDVQTTDAVDASPLKVKEKELMASVRKESACVVVAPVAKRYSEMNSAEKKVVRKAVKTEIKNYLKHKEDHTPVKKGTQALDYNLKMAIIFGAVALTLSFFGGANAVFWIASVIALVIGVVFFIKWIAEQ